MCDHEPARRSIGIARLVATATANTRRKTRRRYLGVMGYKATIAGRRGERTHLAGEIDSFVGLGSDRHIKGRPMIG